MKVPNDVKFPEYTNAGINAALTADKLNEVLAFLRDKYPEDEAFLESFEELGIYKGTLKPDVRITKNGKYYIPGKGFIKKDEAFL